MCTPSDKNVHNKSADDRKDQDVITFSPGITQSYRPNKVNNQPLQQHHLLLYLTGAKQNKK